jgi:hypothetical protein
VSFGRQTSNLRFLMEPLQSNIGENLGDAEQLQCPLRETGDRRLIVLSQRPVWMDVSLPTPGNRRFMVRKRAVAIRHPAMLQFRTSELFGCLEIVRDDVTGCIHLALDPQNASLGCEG